MNIRSLSGSLPERAAPASRPAALENLPADVFQPGPSPDQAAGRWLPKGQVAIPHPVPTFKPNATIDDIAGQLKDQWAQRMGGKEKCTVGILCERGWKPTVEHDEVLDIADAIMDAGGLPKLLYIGQGDPKEQMKGIQALAMPGGRDVDPSKYGEKLGPHMDPKEPDAAFDDFEITAIRHAFDEKMPMLGHCRGTQIMNVAAGGTLVEDIPTEFHSPDGWGSKYGTRINHRPEAVRGDYAARIHPVHMVYVEEGSRLSSMVGSLEAVNSIHHQCIGAISPMLLPVVFALDGLVEGVQRKDMPWQAGYQFHPEALRYTDSRFQGVYDNLVADGVKYAKGELK